MSTNIAYLQKVKTNLTLKSFCYAQCTYLIKGIKTSMDGFWE